MSVWDLLSADDLDDISASHEADNLDESTSDFQDSHSPFSGAELEDMDTD